MIKRSFDIFFAVLGVIILSPIFLVLATWIAIDTEGPILFRQVRVGLNEELFFIHKFRTMLSNAENMGGQLTVNGDHRITSAGRFLRRYKLDELPQLFDVIIGHMSIVGPRPEVPKYVSYYPLEAKVIIFSVKPGITDYASLHFKDENDLLISSVNMEHIYIHQILPIKIKYYIEYVKNNTIYGDIKIILKTLKMISTLN